MEGWGKGKFPEGVSLRRKKMSEAHPHPVPVKHPITIQDGGVSASDDI